MGPGADDLRDRHRPQTSPVVPGTFLDIITLALPGGIATQAGVTVVIASHDPNVHETADWLFELRDGRLIGTNA
jgi:hypothetical protein